MECLSVFQMADQTVDLMAAQKVDLKAGQMDLSMALKMVAPTVGLWVA